MATTLLLNVHDCPRCGVSLKAADQLAEEDLTAMSRAKPILAECRHPRSVPQHRLLFALIRKAAAAAPSPIAENALRQWLTIETGNFDAMPLGFGEFYKAPRSWAFDKMDQQEFRKLFDEVVKLIFERVAPALPQSAVDELLAMLEDPSMGDRAAGAPNKTPAGAPA